MGVGVCEELFREACGSVERGMEKCGERCEGKCQVRVEGVKKC